MNNTSTQIKSLSRNPSHVLRHIITPRLAIPTQEGIYILSWNEIVRCAADSNYTQLFLNDGTSLVVSKTLAKVESMLPSMEFVRTHQSHLVNIGSIRCVAADTVKLHCGSVLPVSRQKRTKLMDAINLISKRI